MDGNKMTEAYVYDKLEDVNIRPPSPRAGDTDAFMPRRRRAFTTAITFLSIIKDVLLVFLSIAALVACYKLLAPGRETAPAPCDCGDSVAEARQLGCEYDTMAAAWLPQHCIDKELRDEFDRAGDGPDGRWQYWADAEHQHPLTIDEVAQLADSPGTFFYTTPRWHFGHCFFYWRKMQRARHNGVTIEKRYDNERHTKHCGKMFDNPGHVAYSYVELKSSNPEPPAFLKDLPVVE